MTPRSIWKEGSAARPLRARRLACAGLLVLMLSPALASAQRGLRPSDATQEMPSLTDASEQPARDAVSIEVIEDRDPKGPHTRPPSPPPATPPPLSIRAQSIDLIGCTAFDADAQARWTRDWIDRPLDALDLNTLTRSIREAYYAAGYTTTEVILPDQDLEGGRLRIAIVEGRVEAIAVEGARFHHPAFLEARLRQAVGTPLHVPTLIARLEAIQSEGAIDRIAATLAEVGPARHRLVVHIEDRLPWRLRLGASNHRSPSVGAPGGRVEVANDSLLGLGDRILFTGHWTEGLEDFALRWEVPVTPWDTRASVSWRKGNARVIEDDFEAIDIQGRFDGLALGLHQSVWRTRQHRLDTALVGEWRRSVSTLLDRIECFQADLEDCTPSAAVLRWQMEYLQRAQRSGLALRSTLSFGVDALGATTNADGGDRDGKFLSWLLQTEWAGLLSPIEALPFFDGHQLLIRGALQLANDPLLSFEQISIGGARSVRGFRQNQLVRDNGAWLQAEWRLPLLASGFGDRRIEGGPFIDYGSAWDRRRNRSNDETLVSIGLALRVQIDDRIRGEVSWAHRLRDDLPRGDRTQRNGFFFEVTWDVF